MLRSWWSSWLTGWRQPFSGSVKQKPEKTGSSALHVIHRADIDSLSPSIQHFAGQLASWMEYPLHKEYVIWFCLDPWTRRTLLHSFARLRAQNRAKRFAAIKLINIVTNVLLTLFFLLLCPYLYSHYPGTLHDNWLFGLIYRSDWSIEYVFIANLLQAFSPLCCWHGGIQDEVWISPCTVEKDADLYLATPFCRDGRDCKWDIWPLCCWDTSCLMTSPKPRLGFTAPVIRSLFWWPYLCSLQVCCRAILFCPGQRKRCKACLCQDHGFFHTYRVIYFPPYHALPGWRFYKTHWSGIQGWEECDTILLMANLFWEFIITFPSGTSSLRRPSGVHGFL